MGSCGGCGGSVACWNDGGSVGWNGVSEERVWWAVSGVFVESAGLCVFLAVKRQLDGDL